MQCLPFWGFLAAIRFRHLENGKNILKTSPTISDFFSPLPQVSLFFPNPFLLLAADLNATAALKKNFSPVLSSSAAKTTRLAQKEKNWRETEDDGYTWVLRLAKAEN